MWLLSTDRAELQFFATPNDVPKGYAILSHVWDKEEQTFQDVQALRTQCAASGAKPRDLASPKIKNFCVLAESHGYRWIWIDTCCIDKTSSSELSEAINSMFLYYSLAEVCYAYLRDVPTYCAVEDCASEFGTSMWHKRGWTLQELLAPQIVVFLSKTWEVIGTKADLAPVLESVTSVPAGVLTMERELADISVAARMSWAADRRTTRPEDEAYCLMGLFGIHMPTLYGEGRQAFRRLQEEIMRQSVDTSIFAWGHCRPGFSTSLISTQYVIHDHADETYLLAPSPAAFRGCSNRHFSPPSNLPSQPHGQSSARKSSADNIVRGILEPPASDAIGLPTFTITPYGVLAHAPIIEAFDLTVLVLFCTQDKQHIGLLLHRCPDAPDPSRPLYHVCSLFSSAFPARIGRMIDLGEDVTAPQLKRAAVTFEWRSIYLAHRPPPAPPTRMLLNRGKAAPFRIPLWHLKELELNAFVDLLTPANRVLQFPWNGTPPAILRFRLKQPVASGDTRRDFTVCLGRCTEASTSESQRDRVRSLGPHWANVQPLPHRDADRDTPTHDCAAHHVAEWPRQAKTFSMWGGSLGAVLLSFAACPLNPAGTYVVTIKPLGWPVSAPKRL